MRFDSKTALITGGASGIGKAVACRLASEGAAAIMADHNTAAAREAASLLRKKGGNARAVNLDVTSPSDWDRVVQEILGSARRLDILVNCAGITDDAPITELTLEQWRAVFAVNLEGTFLGTATALRAMRSTGHGAIVNIASLSGVKPSAGAAAYCASKAGVIQLTRVAALECSAAGSRIRVNCVTPGGVRTPMWETTPMWPDIARTEEWLASRDVTALHRFADPEEIAAVVAFLASDEASYVNGAILAVDGGASL